MSDGHKQHEASRFITYKIYVERITKKLACGMVHFENKPPLGLHVPCAVLTKVAS